MSEIKKQASHFLRSLFFRSREFLTYSVTFIYPEEYKENQELQDGAEILSVNDKFMICNMVQIGSDNSSDHSAVSLNTNGKASATQSIIDC